jgi:cystathionine beta-lyase family protein involved in aluminum resistance
MNQSLLNRIEEKLAQTVWPQFESTYYHTFSRVLDAFIKNRVAEEHFSCVTGYGHDDIGREVLDAVFAHALQAESALVRPHIVSGTHALATGLQGCLMMGQTMLSITGRPYDTLEEVIGIRGDSRHSLKARGIHYQEFSVFQENGDSADANNYKVNTDFSPQQAESIRKADLIFIQRSRGYSLRPSLSMEQIEQLIRSIRLIKSDTIVMVDNCYGEFTQINEPTGVGADLIAGSLIKNPGAGIVPAGGYLAGRKDLIESCGEALTCPGIGTHGGYMFDLTRTMLQGLYLAPGTVREALKGMSLAANLLEEAGYATAPKSNSARSDIIQLLMLGDSQKLIRFCQILQSKSPINSHVSPIPAQPPGYADEVVMAGGTFIEGSTIELSADGPLRPPYAAFLQGGLTYAHARLVMQEILEQLLN